jgi:hypothetical protein
MAQVDVGFDPDAQFAGPGDTLKTTGLGNCIAIVAYDTGGQGAVMRHYDTLNAYDGTEADPISRGLSFTFKQDSFAGVRDATRDLLLQNVGNANVAYAVSLGGVWHNIDSEKALFLSRHNLLMGLKDVLGVEATTASGEATFDVDAQNFT